MPGQWSDEVSRRVRDWCDSLAALGVDALVDAGLVIKSEFKQATDIVAEELFVRLCLHDYPPEPGSFKH